jgi:hypothetical protein
MREMYERFKYRFISVSQDNSGVAAVEVILILVVLIGLVIIFKTQAVSLVTKIWNTITENASTVTG